LAIRWATALGMLAPLLAPLGGVLETTEYTNEPMMTTGTRKPKTPTRQPRPESVPLLEL
jgi:hypothetical protein